MPYVASFKLLSYKVIARCTPSNGVSDSACLTNRRISCEFHSYVLFDFLSKFAGITTHRCGTVASISLRPGPETSILSSITRHQITNKLNNGTLHIVFVYSLLRGDDMILMLTLSVPLLYVIVQKYVPIVRKSWACTNKRSLA